VPATSQAQSITSHWQRKARGDSRRAGSCGTPERSGDAVTSQTRHHRPHIGQRRHRIARGHILHRHVIAVPGFADRPEHVPVINLTCPRFMPAGNVAYMEVTDRPNIRPQGLDQVPLHDLDVIEVKENLQKWTSDLTNNPKRLRSAIKVVLVMVRYRIQRFGRSERVDLSFANTVSVAISLRCNAFIAVMQFAKLRNLNGTCGK